eukprot:3296124-Pyramimonas_sp.AAC.1
MMTRVIYSSGIASLGKAANQGILRQGGQSGHPQARQPIRASSGSQSGHPQAANQGILRRGGQRSRPRVIRRLLGYACVIIHRWLG